MQTKTYLLDIRDRAAYGAIPKNTLTILNATDNPPLESKPTFKMSF